MCNISLIIFRVGSELSFLSCSLCGFPLGSSPPQFMSVGGWTVLNYPCEWVCERVYSAQRGIGVFVPCVPRTGFRSTIRSTLTSTNHFLKIKVLNRTSPSLLIKSNNNKWTKREDTEWYLPFNGDLFTMFCEKWKRNKLHFYF